MFSRRTTTTTPTTELLLVNKRNHRNNGNIRRPGQLVGIVKGIVLLLTLSTIALNFRIHHQIRNLSLTSSSSSSAAAAAVTTPEALLEVAAVHPLTKRRVAEEEKHNNNESKNVVVVDKASLSGEEENNESMNVVVMSASLSSTKPTPRFALDPSPAWEHPTDAQLPMWMKDYFAWHRAQRQLAYDNKDNPDFYLGSVHLPVLVVRCLAQDTKCGGAADRLMALPIYVMMAAKMQRILLFHWERPCPLSEFLIPAGIDWTIDTSDTRVPWNANPQWNWYKSAPLVRLGTYFYRTLHPEEGKSVSKRLPPVVTVKYQGDSHGADWYDQYKDAMEQIHQQQFHDQNVSISSPQPSFAQVYTDCWHSVFRPAAPVQAQIDQMMQKLNLQRNQYVATHIRALYDHEAIPTKTMSVAQNALRCASQLRHRGNEPIYVTSDLVESITASLEYAAQKHPEVAVVARMVAIINGTVTMATPDGTNIAPPLHLDRGASYLSKDHKAWTEATDCSAYYDTFVDLYLLAYASCRAYHVGSYARWANLISSDYSCHISHFQKKCKWKKELPSLPSTTY